MSSENPYQARLAKALRRKPKEDSIARKRKEPHPSTTHPFEALRSLFQATEQPADPRAMLRALGEMGSLVGGIPDALSERIISLLRRRPAGMTLQQIAKAVRRKRHISELERTLMLLVAGGALTTKHHGSSQIWKARTTRRR
jgi:hypothetical protein